MAMPKAARVPPLIYGTAWKKGETRALVKQAILAGFRGVDTAAQPKHYQEHLVGEGIRDALREGVIRREHLYVTLSHPNAPIVRDPSKMPYDPNKSITHQVGRSVTSSLHNLRHLEGQQADHLQPYIDCLVLHSPYPSMEDTQEAWRAMEIHVPEKVCTLGISNVYQIEILRALYDFASVKPSIVQNRFYAGTGYDREIRAFCIEKGMKYQSFWTLTANPNLLRSDGVARVAEQAGVSKPVAFYGLVLGLGNTSVLDGTTNEGRMREDLSGVRKVQEWSQGSPDVWRETQHAFQMLIDA